MDYCLTVGERDEIYDHTLTLDAALARAGKAHELRVFPGEGHGLSQPARAELIRVMLDFFARHMTER